MDDLQQPHTDKLVESVTADGTGLELRPELACKGQCPYIDVGHNDIFNYNCLKKVGHKGPHHFGHQGYEVPEDEYPPTLEQQLAAARAEAQELRAEHTEAYGYGSRLLKLLAPECEPLPTLPGLMTQLDNYIAGLREKAVALRNAMDTEIAERDRERTERDQLKAKIAEIDADKAYIHAANVANEWEDRYETLKQQNDQLRERLAWRPIETAPRDGTTVFVWWAGRIQRGAYLGPRHGRPISDWYVVSRGIWYPTNETVYHWLPLPEPPKEEK